MLIFYWKIRYTEVKIENEHVKGGFKGNIADLLLIVLIFYWNFSKPGSPLENQHVMGGGLLSTT